MSDIPEAVDPAPSELPAKGAGPQADSGHTHDSACLNCGTTLVGSHCHACGQRAEVHRTLGALLHDLLHGALHFEGKVWRTLPMLFWRPGRLTREYIDGRRASYVSPVALFLFSVFVMFAALQIGSVVEPEPPAEATTTIGEDGRIVVDPDGPGGGSISMEKTGWEWADNATAKATENPSLMLYKLQMNSYKFSWLLIPLSVPFVWLLFAWRRRFGAYDHAVFVTYSLCFVSLLFVTLWVLDWIGVPGSLRFFAVVLIPPIHIYRQLRGAYGLRRRSALWRHCGTARLHSDHALDLLSAAADDGNIGVAFGPLAGPRRRSVCGRGDRGAGLVDY